MLKFLQWVEANGLSLEDSVTDAPAAEKVDGNAEKATAENIQTLTPEHNIHANTSTP